MRFFIPFLKLSNWFSRPDSLNKSSFSKAVFVLAFLFCIAHMLIHTRQLNEVADEYLLWMLLLSGTIMSFGVLWAWRGMGIGIILFWLVLLIYSVSVSAIYGVWSEMRLLSGTILALLLNQANKS